MLKLEFEKENFKRYNNGKGYSITVDAAGSRKIYSVFNTPDIENGKYKPTVILDNYKEGGEDVFSYNFEIINFLNLNEKDVDKAIEELEKYLTGYKSAKESIIEFKEAIREGSI